MVLAGCMVGSVTGERQRYNFLELKKKTPWANLYINPSQVFDLPNILRKEKILSNWALKKFAPKTVETPQLEKNHAYVNISQGCDNFCSFCVVPFARGTEVSRPERDILAEVAHLAERGYEHITLCGQNVNSWGLDIKERFKVRTGSRQKIPFAGLLRKVCSLEKVIKVDFISSNPFDFTQDLIEAIKEHVAEAPPDDDPQDAVEDDIVHHLAGPAGPRPGRAPASEPPGDGKAHQVHQPVPVDLQGPKAERDGVDVGIGQHGRGWYHDRTSGHAADGLLRGKILSANKRE